VDASAAARTTFFLHYIAHSDCDERQMIKPAPLHLSAGNLGRGDSDVGAREQLFALAPVQGIADRIFVYEIS
jgi:hypothetical protein